MTASREPVDTARVRRSDVGLHAALILSGVAGLVYETAWTRLLHRVFGVGDLAVATVLATFFLGMGIGNALTARWVQRIRRPARAYAILEAAIGLYALASLAIIPGVGAAYGAVGADAGFTTLTVVRFVLSALVLLPPTILMGATLPIVAEASRSGAWSRAVTGLYASNTVGAVIGAALASFVLVPKLGTRSTVIAGVLASFAAAAVVLAVLRDARKEEVSKPSTVGGVGGDSPMRLAAGLTFLAGLTSLGSEVVWTRVLRIVVHGTTQAFGAMLVNYLVGIALGALIARALSRRFHPATVFGVSQALLVVVTAVAMALVPFAPRVVPLLSHAADTVPHATWIIGAVSGALLLPIAMVLGTGLPATWAMIERGSDAGRGAALLLAANTLGGLVGSLVVGFGAIPAIGTEATLLGLACVNAVASSIALRHAAPDGDSPGALLSRVGRLVLPLVALTVVLGWRPSIELRFLLTASTNATDAIVRGPSASWDERVVFLREGRNTTVTLVNSGGSMSLFNDGRPESGFTAGTPGFGPELVALGGLPGVLAGERHDAMIIGLGAGHTATMALATGFEHVRVVELEEAVVEAARTLHQARQRPFALDDRRAELVVDDARNQLQLMPADSLDAVISQPSHPWLAGSSALYTREFFGEVNRALRDDGVFGLWLNLFRMDVPHVRAVLRTLLEVFPHVRGFVVEGSSLVLMASSTPRRLDVETSELIRSADEGGPYFEPYGLGDVRGVLVHQEFDDEGARSLANGGALIEDDRPLLELELALLPMGTSLVAADIDRALVDVPWSSEPLSDDLLVARIDAVEARASALTRIERMAPTSPWVRGRLAEARGDVTRALAEYDSAPLPESMARALALRYDEGLVLGASSRVEPLPDEIARRALASGDGEGLDLAASPSEFARWTGLALACAPASLQVRADWLSYPEVPRRLGLCAVQAHDEARAAEFEQLAWRARTVLAAEWTRRGDAASAGGNGGLALLYFQRALRSYPTTTRAAIGLAQLHQRDGRPEAAADVLRRTFAATEGLTEARERLSGAAQQLGIALNVEAADVAATSASTERPSTPPRE